MNNVILMAFRTLLLCKVDQDQYVGIKMKKKQKNKPAKGQIFLRPTGNDVYTTFKHSTAIKAMIFLSSFPTIPHKFKENI